MSRATPRTPKRYGEDDWERPAPTKPPASMQVETSDPSQRVLYGPTGEQLAVISNRPPVGFHQGTRS